MAGSVRSEADIRALLASLETNLDSLAKARDPKTADLAHELQNVIDKIRAEIGQIDVPLTLRKAAHG
jgi:hypothetical protein